MPSLPSPSSQLNETIPSQPSPVGKHRAFSFPRPPPWKAPTARPGLAQPGVGCLSVRLSAARWFYFTRKGIQPPPPLSSGLPGGRGGGPGAAPAWPSAPCVCWPEGGSAANTGPVSKPSSQPGRESLPNPVTTSRWLRK